MAYFENNHYIFCFFCVILQSKIELITMRHALLYTFIMGMFSNMSVIFAYANNDGLYFNSHSYTTAYRTTLQLNNGNTIDVNDGFNMSFNIDLRTGESFFWQHLLYKDKRRKAY